MKSAFLFLTTGFEEMEAVIPTDILRRGGVKVTLVSLESEHQVMSAHLIPIQADVLFDKIADDMSADVLILPGGTERIAKHPNLQQKIKEYADADKLLAAVCLAPMVLGQMGLLHGKKATCYPGYEKYLKGATYLDAPAYQDGKIITGKGPSRALEFGLLILEALMGKKTRDEVARDILFDH